MSSALKRELLFWVIVVAAIVGYLGVGWLVAPTVPPETPAESGGVVDSKDGLDRLIADLRQRKERKDAIDRRNEFLQRWHQWGAGVGLVLLIVYTLWRPPWRTPDETPEPDSPKAKPRGKSLPMSARAMFLFTSCIVLAVALLVLIILIARQSAGS